MVCRVKRRSERGRAAAAAAAAAAHRAATLRTRGENRKSLKKAERTGTRVQKGSVSGFPTFTRACTTTATKPVNKNGGARPIFGTRFGRPGVCRQAFPKPAVYHWFAAAAERVVTVFFVGFLAIEGGARGGEGKRNGNLAPCTLSAVVKVNHAAFSLLAASLSVFGSAQYHMVVRRCVWQWCWREARGWSVWRAVSRYVATVVSVSCFFEH